MCPVALEPWKVNKNQDDMRESAGLLEKKKSCFFVFFPQSEHALLLCATRENIIGQSPTWCLFLTGSAMWPEAYQKGTSHSRFSTATSLAANQMS